MIDIPEWANYIAQDADGKWYAYKHEPFISYPTTGEWSIIGFKKLIGQGLSNPDYWENSILKVNEKKSYG